MPTPRIDVLAKSDVRQRRAIQKITRQLASGEVFLGVDPPITLSGGIIDLAIYSLGGLTVTSDQLSILLDGSSLTLGASGLKLGVLTTKGDIISYSTVPARLGVGTNGQVLTADSAETTGLKWATPSTGTTSPLTTKGDIWVYGAADTRLPVGTDSYVLSANSAMATGLEWVALGASGLTLGTNPGLQFTTGGGTNGLVVDCKNQSLNRDASGLYVQLLTDGGLALDSVNGLYNIGFRVRASDPSPMAQGYTWYHSGTLRPILAFNSTYTLFFNMGMEYLSSQRGPISATTHTAFSADYDLPADFLTQAGTTIHMIWGGVYTTSGTPGLSFSLRLGGTSVFELSHNTPDSVTDQRWMVEAELMRRAGTDAAAEIVGWMRVTLCDANDVYYEEIAGLNNPEGATPDTTGALPLALYVEWTAGSPNAITLRYSRAWVSYADSMG